LPGWNELFYGSKQKVAFLLRYVTDIRYPIYYSQKGFSFACFFRYAHEPPAVIAKKSFIVNGNFFFHERFSFDSLHPEEITPKGVEEACGTVGCETFTARQCDDN
jgi:hypothetical protein